MGLVGPSASGKTTLVRLMLGLRVPNSGTVRLDGVDLAGWPRDQLIGAIGNGAGVGLEFGRALGKANDPDTEPGQVDFDAANRAAQRVAGGIEADAGGLSGHPEPDEGPGGPRI